MDTITSTAKKGRKQTHYHPEAINEDGVYECVKCGYSTSYPSRYSTHIKTTKHKIFTNSDLARMLQEIKV